MLAALCGLALAAPSESVVFERGRLVFTTPAYALEASAETGLSLIRYENRRTSETLRPARDLFRIVFRDGREAGSGTWKPLGKPTIAARRGNPRALRNVDRAGTRVATLRFRDEPSGLEVEWRGVLATGQPYWRQELTLKTGKTPADVAAIVLADLAWPASAVVGTVPGSPLASDSIFAGAEFPMAETTSRGGVARSQIVRRIPLAPATRATVSSVIGASEKGQLRRTFAAYLESERARPYAPFLHYNSWYDIGYFTPYTQEQALDRIRAFGEALVRQRGVAFDGFLFDDGWDDTATVWEFHKGFPNGFAPLRAEAAKYGAAPGIWLSPWGGYGPPREARLKTGRALGFEVDDQGFALSGPKYFARFREVTQRLVREYGIGAFKLDGTGSPDKQVPGSAFASDFEAAIALIEELRGINPKLFVNLTTGTWPSPFWTRTADSIWRGGWDHEFAGEGTRRQQWITYRDADTYHGVVRRGPLYPLNSLMVHGVIFAQHARGLNDDPGNDLRGEIRTAFGMGTQLQELYVTPGLMTPQNWDDLAEAARWSRGLADVLRDVRWVGGDPKAGEVYGWAAWSPRIATLTLRNPAPHAQAFAIQPRDLFELPEEVGGAFEFRSPWASDAGLPAFRVDADGARAITLAPFEVRVWEVKPH